MAVLYCPLLQVVQQYADSIGRIHADSIVHFSSVANESTPFQVVNLYDPNRKIDGEAFFQAAVPHIEPSVSTFVCGDFNTVVDPILIYLIADVKASLQLEHSHQAHGARLRAKNRWAEEGETSSAYFFQLVKTKSLWRLFTGIRNAQGVVVRSISAIIHVWCIFYIQLFTAAVLSPCDQDFFLDSLDRKLPDPEAALCEGDVSVKECLVAL